jgi:hypothetical protein
MGSELILVESPIEVHGTIGESAKGKDVGFEFMAIDDKAWSTASWAASCSHTQLPHAEEEDEGHTRAHRDSCAAACPSPARSKAQHSVREARGALAGTFC